MRIVGAILRMWLEKHLSIQRRLIHTGTATSETILASHISAGKTYMEMDGQQDETIREKTLTNTLGAARVMVGKATSHLIRSSRSLFRIKQDEDCPVVHLLPQMKAP